MTPRLSVLIPTIECRQNFLSRLLAQLDPQRARDVEILTASDNGEVTIGQKRNGLLAMSSGAYIAFVDDDDQIAPNYVRSIVDGTSSAPDVVCFDVGRTCDGRHWGRQRHSIHYRRDGLIDFGGERYEWRKIPNHLCAVRRELAIATGFKPWNNCEDSEYAGRLLPLLKSEVQIYATLYTYDYRANRPGEQTNKDREQKEPAEIAEYRGRYWDNHRIEDAGESGILEVAR